MTNEPTSRTQLLDAMRGRWERRGILALDGLIGYVEGYADARHIAPDDTWKTVAQWVYEYFSIEPERAWHWSTQIARRAPCYATEIPLLYAAVDKGRNVRYEACHIWKSDETWRAAFNKEERRINSLRPEMARPAPKQLITGCVGPDIWRLFFVDERGYRYEEHRMASESESKIWAEKHPLLRVPVDAWSPLVE